MVVVAATLLAGAPVAVAGNYNVVSCRVPGAGGVNSAWTPLLSSFNSTAQPEGFDLVYDCPGAGSQLTARSAARAGQDAFWSHSANHHFAAPPGTAITKLVIWRWGQMVRTDSGVNDWKAFGQTDDGPLASMVIYGFVVTITDQQAPTLKPAGPLLTAGWRRPSDIVTYDASDSTGIRAARLEIGGRTTRAARACDYRRPAPCSNVAGGRIAVPAGVPDGTLAARIIAEVVQRKNGGMSISSSEISSDDRWRSSMRGPRSGVRRPSRFVV